MYLSGFQAEIADNIFSPIIIRRSYPCRSDPDFIVAGEFLVGMVQLRVIQVRISYGRFRIVRDKKPRHASVEFHHVYMRLRPAFLVHAQKSLHKRKGTITDRGYKEIRPALRGSIVIQHRDRVAYPVNECFSSRDPFLRKDDLYAGCLQPDAVAPAELAVTEPVRVFL